MKWFNDLSDGGRMYLVCTAVYFIFALIGCGLLYGIYKEIRKTRLMWYYDIKFQQPQEIDESESV